MLDNAWDLQKRIFREEPANIYAIFYPLNDGDSTPLSRFLSWHLLGVNGSDPGIFILFFLLLMTM